jgi:hypothetical protein
MSSSIPSLKKEHVSNDVKDMIMDIVEDKYNANLFNKMKQDNGSSNFVRVLKFLVLICEFTKVSVTL